MVTIGLITSILVLFFAITLFRYEERRGFRVAERARRHVDFFVLKVEHELHKISRFLGRDFIRQVFHYIFHTFLRLILTGMRKGEKGLQNIMRVNKTLAKNAERENAVLSKLEEIALHKVESALTEDEKRVHRDKMLSGM